MFGILNRFLFFFCLKVNVVVPVNAALHYLFHSVVS